MWYCILSCPHHHNQQVEVARACGSHGGWQATAYSSIFILEGGVNEGKAWGTSPEVKEVCA